MRVELTHEIEIDAPAEAVWEVLVGTEDYPRWNPFVRRIVGPLEPGARLEVEIAPPGGRSMTFRPRVLEASPGRAVRWLGHLGVPGLFDGEHRFLIEPLPDGRVRFVHGERFAGMLVRPLRGSLDRTELGFAQMNHALKAEVERRYAVACGEAEDGR